MADVRRAALSPFLIVLLWLTGCSRPARPTLVAAPTSVLLITIDTLRADRLGAYGDPKARTPNIDALAHDGVLFESAYAAAPITLPSHVTLMTGLDPSRHGVHGNGGFRLGSGPRTLAEVLKAHGLETAAFVGAFPLGRRFRL